ncbi:hypothetical protein GCM10023189_24680 [Nibrella saemangeumensis]|uniref:Uncharacterized protein n=1 Tax=Nibrella saemangeumensis TaxID=1084526 RepID=A0ABP8MWD2_9BACT
MYPHIWFWLEQVPHALALVRQINRPQLGLAFNLPHYLALTNREEQRALTSLLTECKPYLKLMTICGATPTDETDSRKIWNYLIQPLGQGSFDTFGLVQFAIREVGFNGPIGLQSYNLKGNKPNNMRRSLAVWNTWKQKLEAQP